MAMYYSAKPSVKSEGWGVKKDGKPWLERKQKKNYEKGEV